MLLGPVASCDPGSVMVADESLESTAVNATGVPRVLAPMENCTVPVGEAFPVPVTDTVAVSVAD